MPTETDLIELAAAHGSTKWVKEFIRAQLLQLIEQSTSPEAFAALFEQALQSRKLTTPAQQKNYRSNLCQALKVFDTDHSAHLVCQSAIALVSPTPEQYRALNDEQRGRLADRETKFFTSQTAELLVERAIALLNSSEWSEVGAGLAVLIGRRISEILLSEFSLKSPWSLNFSEMAKKSGAEELTIEIPTLAPAPTVLAAIQKLQGSLNIADLKVDSLISKIAKQKVNGQFSGAIAQRCDQHFSDLIPARSDRDNLYSHLFRAVYATIAVHWFCPPNTPEHQFKAEIQGHFTIAQDGRKLPNFSARANYDDYAIGTDDGNRDGRLGIKLGQLPDLQVIEAFRKAEVTADVAYIPTPVLLDIETMRAFAARAVNLLLSNESTDWAISILALTGQFPETFEKPAWKEFTPFSIVVQSQSWEIPTLTAARQVLSGVRKLKATDTPRQQVWLDRARAVYAGLLEIETLTDLQAIYTLSALFRFCPHHVEDETFIQAIRGTVSPRFQLASRDRGSWLDQRNVEILQVFQSSIESIPTMTDSDSKPANPTAVPVDLDLLRSVCEVVGVEMEGQDSAESALAELLGWVKETISPELEDGQGESEISVQSEQSDESELSAIERLPNSLATNWEQAISDQARTLALLSTQVERLQHQNQQLQTERDVANTRCNNAISQLSQLQSVPDSGLQQELDELRQQNEQLKTKVQRLTTALLSEGGIEPSVAPSLQQTETDLRSQTLGTVRQSTPLQRQERKSSNPERSSRGNATPKVHRIIDAILEYNQHQPDSSQRLRVSIPIVKEIGKVMNATYQPVIQQVLRAREAELEERHQEWMLSERHNRHVQNLDGIIQSIQQKLLPIERPNPNL